jgi:hypothetical protein
MRPLRMLLQPACTRTKSDQAHSTSSITCACTRPASCCSVLQRPASRLPLSADPHRMLCCPLIRFAGWLYEEGKGLSAPVHVTPTVVTAATSSPTAGQTGCCCMQCLAVGRLSAHHQRQLLTPTTLRLSIASTANCTRFSDPACVTSRLPVHAQVPLCLAADCQATAHQAFKPVLFRIRRLRCQK